MVSVHKIGSATENHSFYFTFIATQELNETSAVISCHFSVSKQTTLK